MPRIRKILTSAPFLIGSLFFIVLSAYGVRTGVTIYSTNKALDPKPPVYRDVNMDGIKDKIIQVPLEKIYGADTYLKPLDVVCYGEYRDGEIQFRPSENTLRKYNPDDALINTCLER